jgi:hypothetical protein
MRYASEDRTDSPDSTGIRRPRHPRRYGRALVAAGLATVLAAGLVTGCGDDSTDDPDQSLGEAAESAGARGVAEALRLVLVEDDLGPNQTERDVDVLQESVDDLPGDPEVTGIVDDDGDGVDDDGKVEVHVNSEVACMSVAIDGDVDVTGGAC